MGRKHGFNCQLLLLVDSEYAANNIKAKEFLFIEFDGKGVPFLVHSWDENSGIIKLDAVDSEADAAELEGRNVLMPPLGKDEDEPDFVGFHVYDTHAGLLGSFLRSEEYPGQMMMVVWTDQGEMLIPEGLITAVLDDVKRIVTDLPDGYVEALQ